MRKLFKRFMSDRQGNFAMVGALTLTTAMVIVSAAFEVSRMGSASSKLQSITDMAVLAGAIAADAGESDREAVVLAVIAENSYKIEPITISGQPTVVFDDNSKSVQVEINTKINPVLGKFIGKSELNVSAQSSSLYAPEAITPISVSFALDVSGSMSELTDDGDIKLETLQESISILFEALEAGAKDEDKLNAVLRTGMSAYNTELVDDMDMDYGWEDLDEAVDDLVAGSGTNSVPALQNTYNQLLADRSYREGQGEDISDLIEYAIFMTDGDNNQPEWDTESAEICETMKSDGIELYSIAFAAPEKGEALLLDCASANSGVSSDMPKCIGDTPGEVCTGGDKEEIQELKSRYYYDASDADAFKEAFDEIGDSIAQVYIRLL